MARASGFTSMTEPTFLSSVTILDRYHCVSDRDEVLPDAIAVCRSVIVASSNDAGAPARSPPKTFADIAPAAAAAVHFTKSRLFISFLDQKGFVDSKWTNFVLDTCRVRSSFQVSQRLSGR